MRPTSIPLGEIVSHTWNVYLNNLAILVGATLIVLGLSIVVALVGRLVLGFIIANNLARWFAIAAILFIQISGNLVSLFLSIGQIRICLAVARNQKMDNFMDVMLSGDDKYWPFVGGNVLYGLDVFAGSPMCILPGLVAMLLFWPVVFLIADYQAQVFQSFGLAVEITSKNILTIVLLSLAILGLVIAGILLLAVGLIFTVPFATLFTHRCILKNGWTVVIGHRIIKAHPPRLLNRQRILV